jgi:capsid protein
VQEVTAFMAAVQNGFISRKRVAAEMGYDIEEIDLENARDAARASVAKLPYGVYEGADEMADTPESQAAKKAEQKAFMDALMKMAEAESA